MATSLDIKEPGLNILPLGVERHVVNGGGLTGIQIFPNDEIVFAKPGFINIRFNNNFWNQFAENLINNSNNYGSAKKNGKKYLVEYVSANPTGPLHVGHCRGAILGDVISNILKFNNNEVVKEYYVNDHGSQISHFTYSVYLRIIEILEKKIELGLKPDKSIYKEFEEEAKTNKRGVWRGEFERPEQWRRKNK